MVVVYWYICYSSGRNYKAAWQGKTLAKAKMLLSYTLSYLFVFCPEL